MVRMFQPVTPSAAARVAGLEGGKETLGERDSFLQTWVTVSRGRLEGQQICSIDL